MLLLLVETHNQPRAELRPVRPFNSGDIWKRTGHICFTLTNKNDTAPQIWVNVISTSVFAGKQWNVSSCYFLSSPHKHRQFSLTGSGLEKMETLKELWVKKKNNSSPLTQVAFLWFIPAPSLPPPSGNSSPPPLNSPPSSHVWSVWPASAASSPAPPSSSHLSLLTCSCLQPPDVAKSGFSLADRPWREVASINVLTVKVSQRFNNLCQAAAETRLQSGHLNLGLSRNKPEQLEEDANTETSMCSWSFSQHVNSSAMKQVEPQRERFNWGCLLLPSLSCRSQNQ